jgi:hypothetical protein
MHIRTCMPGLTAHPGRLPCWQVQMHWCVDTVACMSGQVEIKTTKETLDAGNLQKAADFVQAFILGTLKQRRSLPGLHTAHLLA